MRRSVVALALFSAVTAIGCGQPSAPVGPSSIVASGSGNAQGSSLDGTKSGSPAVPFRGTLEGNGSLPEFEPPPSPYFTATLHAWGQATHLGGFTVEFAQRVNLDTLHGVADAVFTAANGDMLKTHVEGDAVPAGSPTAFTVTETHNVTGGTGRFAGAGGTFKVTRSVDFADPTGATSGRMEGSITLHGGTF